MKRKLASQTISRIIAILIVCLIIASAKLIHTKIAKPLSNHKAKTVEQSLSNNNTNVSPNSSVSMPEEDVRDNGPSNFSEKELSLTSYEHYSDLDNLGRCGKALAVITPETMPTKPRESIGMVKPSGWHTVRYDDIIKDKYLYNRCHLIGFQLAGENANPKNLVTGTRYLNATLMLPYENKVADYVRRTKNPVLYKVTPVFNQDNLVCSYINIQAKSLKDNAIDFNVDIKNYQPGIEINYKTGESKRL